MTDTYKGFRVLGDRLLVKVQEPPKMTASGLLHLPDNNSFRPPIVTILAKGPGKATKTVYKDHWFPGSKRWGKAGHEKPLANRRYGPETEDIKVGDHCLTIHPYLKSDKIRIKGEECHIIQSYEVACVIDIEKDEDLLLIEMTRPSVQ